MAEAAWPEAVSDPALWAGPAAPCLLALSGGGDSTALLHFMVERLGPARVIACVIDHGLRAGSAADAARAAAMAEALGARALVRTLTGVKRAQADARAARYAALCAAAREHGAQLIALGHTRDDQAETVLMRAARGSTWRGLAGMRTLAPAPLWPEGRGLSLARPFLGVGRTALRVALEARKAGWIEDPANTNADFARVRARARLAAMADSGFEPMRLAALAAQLTPRAAALDQASAALISRAASFDDEFITIALPDWVGPAPVRTRALSALIAAAAGSAREPDPTRLAALEARLAAPSFSAATLAGALARRVGDAIQLGRDPGALAGRADGAAALAPLPLAAGVAEVWDGRVELTMAEPGWRVAIAAGAPVLTKDGQSAPLAAAAPRWLLRARVRHALAA